MAKTLYYGGEIITMEESLSPEAILLENGQIAQIGEKSKLEISADILVDLKGKVLMPSFIDTYGHITERAKLMDNTKEQTQEELTDKIKMAEQEYLKHGFTTIQDSGTTEKEWKILSEMAQDKKLTADIVCYVDLKNSSYLMKKEEFKNRYRDNLKIGGYKIALDGYLQDKTAWVKGGYESDKENSGHRIHTEKEVNAFVKKALRDKQQLLAQCSGDAACQQLIDAYIFADKQYHFTNSVRPIMASAQLANARQLRQMASLDMIASFATSDIHYFGDTGLEYVGEKGYNFVGISSALDAEIVATLHNASIDLPPNLFFSIWYACTRKTKNGIQLNEKEKITVLEALEAVTINAAYQYFEEDKKGSIRVGKNADFIIIDKNPLTCKIDDIPNIKIFETIKKGEVVYKLL